MGRLLQSQERRLSLFGVSMAVEMHCHCLAGLDDGPEDMAQAIALCRALAGDGATAVIATPHQLGRYELANSASRVRAAVTLLRDALAEALVPLSIWPGAEVRLDERLLKLVDDDEVMTLGDGGRHILLELSDASAVDPLPMIQRLAERGFQTIVSHPERHHWICRKPSCVLPWLDQGAQLQVTAGSLLGDFGTVVAKTAWDLLTAGACTLVASDAHGVYTRGPRMTRAMAEIENRLGTTVAAQVCLQGPAQVLLGGTSQVRRLPLDARLHVPP